MQEIILASTSPRRKELLGMLPITFRIESRNVDESLKKELSAIDNVMDIATRKAEIISKENKEQLVIGCDTIVVLANKILGKPKDEEDAYKMLKSLSGNMHSVYTGVSLMCEKQKLSKVFYVETKVYMKVLTDEEIWRYIATGDCLDKAGAYGIQTRGALLIDKIDGDYFNVVGLPISKLYESLKEIGAISF
ncbi:MAG: Maf family protein [Cellulosilyticaceae bacterium]